MLIWKFTRAHCEAPRRVAVVLLALACSATWASDVDKRFRLSLATGGDAPTEEIRSGAGNSLSVVDEMGNAFDRFTDPRDTSARTGVLEARSGTLSTLSLQYAFAPMFLIEAQVGHQVNDIGQVEIQEVLIRNATARLPVGEMTRIPVRINWLTRFHPDANFNPYIGIGIGYSFVSVETSSEFDQLSENLTQSTARPTILQGANLFDRIDVVNSVPRPVQGATLTTDDAFEWQLVGGAEYEYRNGWAIFVDFGYVFSESRIEVGFDGGEDLGVGVPQATAVVGSELATRNYGPLQLLTGGAVDLTGDGVVDTGYYYIEGGRVRLDGITFQLGVRYTF